MFRGLTRSTGVLVLCLVLPSHAEDVASVEKGLVARWDFENVQGDLVPDVTGRGHDGRAVDARWFTGEFGTALLCIDGKSHVRIPDHDDLHMTEALTLEAWVAPLKHAFYGKFLSRQGDTDSHGYWLDQFPDGRFSLDVGNGQAFIRSVSSRSGRPGRWYHVVGTFADGKNCLYVNGRLAGTAAGPEAAAIGRGHPLIIGAYRGPGAFSYRGVVDEASIYDRALSAEEVNSRYEAENARHGQCLVPSDVDIFVVNPVLTVGKRADVRLHVRNLRDHRVIGKVHVRALTDEGKTVHEGDTKTVTLEPGGSASVEFPFVPRTGAMYKLKLWMGEHEPFLSSHTLIALKPRQPGPAQIDVQPAWRTVAEIDCVAETSPERYCATEAGSHVVDSPLGRYREGIGRQRDRFAFRFRVDHPGKPHTLEVEYPDDKKRAMAIMNGETFDLSCGVLTGGEWRVTNQFHTQRITFWPRKEDNAVMFMDWANSMPSAVRKVTVYEAEGPLPSQKINEPPGIRKRRIGHQWEDPSVKISYGAYSIPEATLAKENTIYGAYERMARYLSFTGQNTYKYPISWYFGPHYPSWLEQPHRMGASPDPDWVHVMLHFFEEQGVQYVPTMMLLRFSSLMDEMNIDIEAIRAGADTLNMITADGQVRCSTNDWTGRSDPKGPRMAPGPIFNPLHPEVQRCVLAVVQEIADRYGDSPAFGGLSNNFWVTSMLWFHSLRNGYGDVETHMFQRDTSVTIPVDSKDPERFQKRYAWLMANAREKWIDWRCRKVFGMMMRIRDILVRRRPDLRLVISCWPWYVRTSCAPPTTENQFGISPSVYEQHREGGLDLKLYLHKPNVDLELQLTPQHLRQADPCAWPPELCMYRDFDMLDDETLELFHSNAPNVAAWAYNSYFETFRTRKKIRGWWFQREFLNHPGLLPAHKYFMEHYAHALAALDATTITRGGLGMSTIGHADDVRRFARAFRTLPAERFDDVLCDLDTVKVREFTAKESTYVYLVNRECEDMEVALSWTARPTGLRNLATGRSIDIGERTVRVTLGPYELLSLGHPPGAARVERASVKAPDAYVERLTRAAEDVRACCEALPGGTDDRGKGQAIVQKLDAALAARRYWRAHMLELSYFARKLLCGAPAVTWRIIGPFDNQQSRGFDTVYPPETEIDFSKTYPGAGGKPVRWQEAPNVTGTLDLDSRFTPNDWVCAYAVTYADAPDTGEAQVWLGSDDGAKVWVNDELVISRCIARSIRPGEDRAKVRLKAGRNKFLIKVEDRVGGWGFHFSLLDAKGSPLRRLKWECR